MSALTVGSLCTGYGGLELGLDAAIGETRVAWVADPEPGPRTVLTHRLPDAPNHGDIKAINWARVEPVDILTAGTPCQGFSSAGRRRGLNDLRSGLVHHMLVAIRELRPKLAVWENVAGAATPPKFGALSPLDRIRYVIEALGYRAADTLVYASDAHAPHARRRCFLIAVRKDIDWRKLLPVQTPAQSCSAPPEGLLPTPTASMTTGPGRSGRAGGPNLQTAVAEGAWATPESRRRLVHWRNITGHPMPAPELDGRMTARWAEWLMGLAPGWVTDVDGLTRTQQMRLLGNGVVPRQAQLAITSILRPNYVVSEVGS
ncbi:DNA cytosine methyltransferase [Actinomyces procaprae]|uniref:DNA cytosine methyltransferase n=1 Tax=Actinomyces procaprae TaxID=2560010 RepID=UPI00109DD9F1|nr:DNA (cytosine-5-)-methyltransferase [Actinomyces procaprae]